MIHAVIFIVGLIGGVSLLVGGVIALAVVIWAQDIPSALRLIRYGYYVLVGLMPIALWFALSITHDDADYKAAYNSPLRALLTTLQGATVGSILGAGPLFLTVVNNLPVILADFEIGEFGSAVRDTVVWSLLLLAVGAAVIAAIPLGLWAYYTGAGRGNS